MLKWCPSSYALLIHHFSRIVIRRLTDHNDAFFPQVEYYGTPVSLKSIAQISTPDASSLLVQPYDKSRFFFLINPKELD